VSGDVPTELAQILGNLAVEWQSMRDAESTLQAIVEGTLAVVPGTCWAGISLIHDGAVQARVPSDPLIAELDTLHTTLDQGPCLDAVHTHRAVLINDTANDSRWPRFTQAAAERGVRSLVSFPLFVPPGTTLGTLNLYAGVTGAFNDQSIPIGQLVAQHASVAVASAAAQTQFDTAIASRDVIGQAKGMLMLREKITSTEAFALMVKTSQETNIKIVDIARWLIEEHEATLHRP
jgi:GAF domain-containing protein